MAVSIETNSTEIHPPEKTIDSIIKPATGSPVVGVVNAQSLSYSLKDIIQRINETNQNAVASILCTLKSNKDIKKNQQLFDLIEAYFSNSFRMSAFCNELESCLRRAQERQLILRVAIQLFKGEEECREQVKDNEKIMRAMEELKKFKAAENLLSVLPQILKKVREQQQSLVDKLRRHEKKIRRKLGIMTTWRIVSDIIFASVAITILICQAVALAAGMNEMANILGVAALASSSFGSALGTRSEKYHNDLKQEIKLISSMRMSALAELTDLDNIKLQIDQLEVQLQSIMQNTDVVLEGEVAVKLGFEEIEKHMEEFVKTLEELGECANACSKHLKKGRLAIQHQINKY